MLMELEGRIGCHGGIGTALIFKTFLETKTPNVRRVACRHSCRDIYLRGFYVSPVEGGREIFGPPTHIQTSLNWRVFGGQTPRPINGLEFRGGGHLESLGPKPKPFLLLPFFLVAGGQWHFESLTSAGLIFIDICLRLAGKSLPNTFEGFGQKKIWVSKQKS